MGGRGSMGFTPKNTKPTDEQLKLLKNYNPSYGYITKFEAGTVYRAYKEGKIQVLPETTSLLYDHAKTASITPRAIANEQYSQDWRFYSRVTQITESLLKGDNKSAQKHIKALEQDQIDRSTKRNPYFKYKKDE